MGSGGCERRIEVFYGKFTTKTGGVGRGVRVDVNDQLKFF